MDRLPMELPRLLGLELLAIIWALEGAIHPNSDVGDGAVARHSLCIPDFLAALTHGVSAVAG